MSSKKSYGLKGSYNALKGVVGMLLYQIKLDENVKNVSIGEKVKYYDKEIYITQINSIDFDKKTITVRGIEE